MFVLTRLQIQNVVEVSLTTNQLASELRDRRVNSKWATRGDAAPVFTPVPVESDVSASAPSITLNPMQIRTFEVTLA